MIIDTIQNTSKYNCIHPLFAKAFEYIRNTDLANTEPGTYVLEENTIKAIISNGQGKTKEASLEKFECHNRFIDIQYCISGVEQMGWKPRGSCVSKKNDYDEEKDLLFYNDASDTFFTLNAGQFVIFFPEDVHAPMISDGIIKKFISVLILVEDIQLIII